jgi:tetratricopeptide (TPR) repeat protein
MKNFIFSSAILMACNVSAQTADSATFYFNKGMEEKTNKRLLVANQAFEKAISFNPQYTEAYQENGAVLMEMRRTDKAKDNFSKLHLLQPENKQAIKELTELYFNFRQYDKAIEFAKKCSDCENANRIIGMSYYEQEDYASAEKALLAAIAKNPADADATYTLARTYLDMEAYKIAVPWYEKAVNMPGSKNVWMYELGLLYYNNNDYKNAVASFNKAANNGYEQKNDFNENLGYASLYAGDFEKGELLLKEVLKRKPNNTTLLRDMSEVFYQQKQYDKSLEYCQKLMELDAKDGKALYQAGMCFQKKGQKDRGQQMCDKAIEMDPSLNSLRKKKEMMGGM